VLDCLDITLRFLCMVDNLPAVAPYQSQVCLAVTPIDFHLFWPQRQYLAGDMQQHKPWSMVGQML